MSNPSVITLVNVRLPDSSKSLRIEDNLGESIHIHFGDLRLDLSVSEFKQLSNQLCLDRILCNDENLSKSIHLLCPSFRFQVRNHLLRIKLFSPKLVSLRRLHILRRINILNLGVLTVRLPLQYSKIYQKAQKPDTDLSNYPQENLYNQSSDQRIDRVRAYIQDLEGSQCSPIVIDQNNTILDGQHRAAVLLSTTNQNHKVLAIEARVPWRINFCSLASLLRLSKRFLSISFYILVRSRTLIYNVFQAFQLKLRKLFVF